MNNNSIDDKLPSNMEGTVEYSQSTSRTKPPDRRFKNNDKSRRSFFKRTAHASSSHSDNKFKKITETVPRHGGAHFDKMTIPDSLAIMPRKSVFAIYTSNLGINSLVPSVYRQIIAKDRQFGERISCAQMQYATHIALLNRVQLVSVAHGTVTPYQHDLVCDFAKNILLPDILSKYVESFGLYKTRNGVKVIPAIGRTFEEHFLLDQTLMLDPCALLQHEGEHIPNNTWRILEQWLDHYKTFCIRAEKTGMSFRAVDNSVLIGSSAMVSSFRNTCEGDIIAYTSESIEYAEAQLIGCYAMRDRSTRDYWPYGDHHLISDDFTTTAYSTRMFLSEICVKSFSTKHY
jgi:hypothetical protein